MERALAVNFSCRERLSATYCAADFASIGVRLDGRLSTCISSHLMLFTRYTRILSQLPDLGGGRFELGFVTLNWMQVAGAVLARVQT